VDLRCFLGLASCAGAVERGASREGDVEPAVQLPLHGRSARSDCDISSMAYDCFRKVGGGVSVRGGISS
jgi:hypothetical protein